MNTNEKIVHDIMREADHLSLPIPPPSTGVKTEDGLNQGKIIFEKTLSPIFVEGSGSGNPSNPDDLKTFSDGQKVLSAVVTETKINKSEYSKSNPNIVE